MRYPTTSHLLALFATRVAARPICRRVQISCRALRLPIVLFLAVQSCASTATRSVGTPNMTSSRHAQLIIRNDHRHAVSVTLLQSSTVYHVGNVDVTSLRSFRLPQMFNGMGVQVLVECRRTGDLYASHEIAWAPRQEVELRVGPYVNLTKLSLR